MGEDNVVNLDEYQTGLTFELGSFRFEVAEGGIKVYTFDDAVLLVNHIDINAIHLRYQPIE